MIKNSAAKGRVRFTLIELLVVIAIIAILASLLLPALMWSKRIANRTVCIGLIDQHNKFVMLYTGDWDEVLPYKGPNTNAYNFCDIWGADMRSVYEDYGMSIETFSCPEAVQTTQQGLQNYYDLLGMCSFYAYYGWMNDADGETNNPTVVPKSPQSLRDDQDQFGNMSVLFSDATRYWDTPLRAKTTNHPNRREGPCWTPDWALIPGAPQDDFCQPLWEVVGYIDGHVGWYHWVEMDLSKYYENDDASGREYSWPLNPP